MRAPHASVRDAPRYEPLAIVGLSFRFPGGATNSEKFWKMMEEKRCAMTEVPKDRLAIDAFYNKQRERPDTMTVRGGHFLEEDLGCFDAPFFSISPAEAAAMDPQQRKLLEVSYHALENAGIPLESITGSKAAVFTGSFADDYRITTLKDPEHMSPYTSSGTEFSILANRLSWWYNLKGPSMNVDNACASSLSALHLACQSLLSYESPMALVGGANLHFAAEQFLAFDNQQLLSSSGQSFSFDHRASGYGRGEGFGVLVIKRVPDALRDGDNIRAIIRGTGAGQDGRTPSITTPSQVAQEALIRDTYLRAQLDPKDTSFVEAHGTGTAQGDPTEARALGRVFGNGRPKGQPLIIGAVKSNIGHLEGCSGIAGVVKTILSLEGGVIPPNANFERLNPDINAEELNIKFPTESTLWPVLDVRRASVNSFGFGGSNAHIILEHTSSYFATTGAMEYREIVDNRWHDSQQASTELKEPQLFVISAYDESGISRLSKVFDDYFADSSYSNTALPDLQNIAHTLAKRRTHLPFRSYAVVNRSSDLVSFSALLSGPIRRRRADGIAFVFTGQGAQYSQMGMQLMAYPVFKASLTKANLCLRALGCDWDLFDELAKLESTSNVQRPEYSQSLCTALQLALVDLLEHFQIRPRKVVGHSSGEIGAAYATGSLSFDSALKVAYFRGRLASSLARDPAYSGSMLAVSLSESQMAVYLIEFQKEYPSHKIFISCINSTRSVTLGGTLDAITAISVRLEVDGIPAQKLRVDVAYHTPHMRKLSQEYERLMGSLESGNPRPGVVMISSVTGWPVESQELQQPRYWVRNMESAVRFSDALSHAISISSFQDLGGNSQEIYDVLEVGPHSALQTPVKDIIASIKYRQEIMYHTALRRKTGALDSLMNTVGRLHCLGYPIDLTAANLSNSKYRRVVANLPSYPFDKSKRYWHESRISQDYRLRKAPRLDLLGAPLIPNGPQQLGRTWRKITKLSEAPWIRDHLINDTVIYPAAGMLCMAVEAIRQLVDPETQIVKYVIREANITHPLLVSPEQGNVESYFHLISRDTETNGQCLTAEFTLFTLDNEKWEQNCTGIVQAHLGERTDDLSNNYENTPMADRKIGCQRQFDITSMYEDFRSAGYEFGPAFQHMESISFGDDQDAYSDIKVFRWEESQSHVIHPVTLDAVFQVMLAARIKSSTEATPTAVPTKIRNLSIAGTGVSFPSEQNLPVYVKVTDMFERTTECYGYGVNEQGNVVVSVDCLETTFVDSRVQASSEHVEQPFCYNIIRKPDCDLLDQTMPLDLGPLSPVHLDRGQYFKDLALLLCNFNMQMTRDLNGAIANIAQPDLRRYLQWIQKQVVTLLPDPNPFAVATGKEPYTLDRMVSLLSQNVSSKSELGTTFATVGRRFVSLVTGQGHPSDLPSQDLFQTFSKEASLQAVSQLQGFIELLAFKSPGLKIIEISGLSGHLAEKILDCAVIRGAHGTSVPAVTKYHLTDASSKRLISAKDRLDSNIRGHSVLDASVLDISKDPTAQGFEKHAYDLIIAANVMHETNNIGFSISNARKLLKPGGKLVLVEPTDNHWIPTAILGVLPGFWKYDKHRDGAPYLPRDKWDEVLTENGFSGVDVALRDDPDSTLYSVLVSTALEESSSTDPWPEIVLVTSDSDTNTSKSAEITSNLTQLLLSTGQQTVTTKRMSELARLDLSKVFCVCLMELEQPYVASMTEQQFLGLRDTLSTTGGILWVRGRSDSAPEFAMIDGVLRVCRSESPTSKFVTLALDEQASSTAIASQVLKVLKCTVENPISRTEVEYEEQGGLLSISRAVPAPYLDSHVQKSETGAASQGFEANATYVVAGGFGGSALSFVRWMAARGAKNFVLLSRSGPKSPAAQQLLEDLRATGVRVEHPHCDISQEEEVKAALGDAAKDMPPIKGCVQGCLVLEDHVFETMSFDQWNAAIRPRVQGTLNLHSALPPNMSFFILLSSVNGVLGNRFQANYAASNAFLDAFAHSHTSSATPSYPVVSLDLGWMLSAGAVAESEFLQQQLTNLGFLVPVRQSQLTGLMDYYCCAGSREVNGITCQTLFGVGFPDEKHKQKGQYPPLLTRPLWRILNMLARGSVQDTPVAETQAKMRLVDILATTPEPSERMEVVCSALIEWMAQTLGIDRNFIDSGRPVHEAGIDSLLAVEMRTWFKRECGANVSVFSIMGNTSTKELCRKAAGM